MRNIKILVPLFLSGLLGLVLWSCDPKVEEDVCLAFDLPTEYLACEEPTICCPLEEEGNCYIVNNEGDNFYCDKTTATDADPDGCDKAENDYITAKCTAKMSPTQAKELKMLLSQYTKEVMAKARAYSICG